MKRLSRTLGLFAILAGFAGAETMEERVKALEEKLKLKEEDEGEAPAPGSPAAEAASKAIDVFFNEGFKFKSKDGNFSGHIGGRVIWHARLFSNMNERQKVDTFAFRQVKLEMSGKLWKDFAFKVQLNTTGSSVALDDGIVGFERFYFAKLHIGQFKAPMSLEELTTTRFIDLPERSVLNRLVPAREVGLMLFGEPFEKIVGYQIMLANGNGRNGPDENSDKDIIARAYLRPFATMESDFIKNLHIAVSGSAGRRDVAAGVLPYTFSDPMTATTFANRGSAGASFKFDENRYRLQAELAWLFGPASFKAEWLRTSDRFTDLNAGDHNRTNIHSYYVSASVLLTGEMKTWDRIRPNKPLFGGGVGAIEIAARFSKLWFDRDIFDDGVLNRDTSAKEVYEYAIGVNWYPNMHTRVSVAYVHEQYRSEAHTESLVLAGTREDGVDMFIFRAQIDF
ncbi:MAG: porin [Planctomycetota bacterium]